METENVLKDNVHHGHNIKRIRQRQGLKQDAMASLVNLSQQTVSRYEATREIDMEMLERFAKALNVPVETLENMGEDAPMIFFENNNITNTNNDKVNNNNNLGSGFDINDNSQNTFNPIEKVVELYERLLKEEKDRNDALNERLAALEELIKKGNTSK